MNFAGMYSPENRRRFLAFGGLLIVVIAILDSVTPHVPLGFLYLFPVLLIAGFLSRREIILVAALCALLTALFSDYHLSEALSFSVMSWMGIAGTGLFVSEIVVSRERTLEHQQELQALVESSPLAIMTFGPDGRILLANDAAQSLLAPGEPSICGQPIAEFLPILEGIAERRKSILRTELRCRGKRKSGETFLAAIWISTATTALGPMIAAIVVDLSQDIREREGESLQFLLANAKILMGAVAHEVRNLCGAIRLTYSNLSRLDGLQSNQDFMVLGAVVQALERLSAMELHSSEDHGPNFVELTSIFDELRVLIEPLYRESGMEIQWRIQEDSRLIRGDRYGLLQVFLNLARNSQRALKSAKRKRLTISTDVEQDSVVIRFEDTGTGIAHPEKLFRPFQNGATSTGLGLYVSRAILKSFGGEIIHETRSEGCCFAVVLQSVAHREALNA